MKPDAATVFVVAWLLALACVGCKDVTVCDAYKLAREAVCAACEAMPRGCPYGDLP